jgi:hypothetical protein
MAAPPLPGGIQDYQFGVDPSRYTVYPKWFEHPSIQIPKGAAFVWPLGIEGFRIAGSAKLGVHSYLGDNAVVVEVAHTDERRIEMSGQFPGNTGVEVMRDLIEILVGKSEFKILRLPGVFPLEQYVVMENYDFNHSEDDRTRSVNYSVTFLRMGVGKRTKRRRVVQPPANPKNKKNKGKPSKVFVVREGARTLRGIAQKVYGTSTRWVDLFELNTQSLSRLNTPYHQMPTKQLPLGFWIHY